MQLDLFLISAARALVEVAGFALIGQGVLALLAGARRHANPFYRILEIVTAPVIKATRLITPSIIHDQHVPALAFFLLFWLWITLALAKRSLCALYGC